LANNVEIQISDFQSSFCGWLRILLKFEAVEISIFWFSGNPPRIQIQFILNGIFEYGMRIGKAIFAILFPHPIIRF